MEFLAAFNSNHSLPIFTLKMNQDQTGKKVNEMNNMELPGTS